VWLIHTQKESLAKSEPSSPSSSSLSSAHFQCIRNQNKDVKCYHNARSLLNAEKESFKVCVCACVCPSVRRNMLQRA
uniref:Uncharacterized protein n=1 Tax=Anopheles quadriannulatus TaxID=34691 RepID=A0A182XR36_ANOQN